MIGYTMYGTNDLPRALAFHDAVFASLGAKRLMEFPSGGVASGSSFGQPMFAIGKPNDGAPASVGNGAMVALAVPQRAQVDAAHAAALENGGSCEGPPGVRGSEGPQAFYGAYFRDPDGNKFAAYRIGAA